MTGSVLLRFSIFTLVVAIVSGDMEPSSEDLEAEAKDEFLALPFPEEGKSISLDVSTGQPVKLDHLGPVVVQSDGKLKRITNWNQMTEGEQKTAFRMVTKRNRKRLAELREAQASKSAEQQEEEEEEQEQKEKSPTPPPLAIEDSKEEL